MTLIVCRKQKGSGAMRKQGMVGMGSWSTKFHVRMNRVADFVRSVPFSRQEGSIAEMTQETALHISVIVCIGGLIVCIDGF